jgi:metal-responsive CopG/Arc/MetJ family transcriptional regulator
MSEKKQGMNVSIWVEQDVCDRLDVIAKKLSMSRSHLAANLVQVGLDDAEVLDNIGVLSLAVLIEKFRRKLRMNLDDAASVVARG